MGVMLLQIIPEVAYITAVLIIEIFTIIYQYAKNYSSEFLTFSVSIVVIGAGLSVFLWFSLLIVGVTEYGNRVTTLVAFIFGYLTDFTLTTLEWGVQVVDPSSEFDLEKDVPGIVYGIVAWHTIIGLAIVGAAIFSPVVYLPVLATALGVVFSNLSLRLLSTAMNKV